MAFTFQVTVDCASSARARGLVGRDPRLGGGAPGRGLHPPHGRRGSRRRVRDDPSPRGARVARRRGDRRSRRAAVPGSPRVLFQEVPEPKTVKNRVHLDIRTGDADVVAIRRAPRRARRDGPPRGPAGSAHLGHHDGPRGQRVLRLAAPGAHGQTQVGSRHVRRLRIRHRPGRPAVGARRGRAARAGDARGLGHRAGAGRQPQPPRRVGAEGPGAQGRPGADDPRDRRRRGDRRRSRGRHPRGPRGPGGGRRRRDARPAAHAAERALPRCAGRARARAGPQPRRQACRADLRGGRVPADGVPHGVPHDRDEVRHRGRATRSWCRARPAGSRRR